jgi:hypothetical protein
MVKLYWHINRRISKNRKKCIKKNNLYKKESPTLCKQRLASQGMNKIHASNN